MSRVLNKNDISASNANFKSRPRFNTSDMALFERLWKGTFQAIIKEQKLTQNICSNEDKNKKKPLKSVVRLAIDKSDDISVESSKVRREGTSSRSLIDQSIKTSRSEKRNLQSFESQNDAKLTYNPILSDVKNSKLRRKVQKSKGLNKTDKKYKCNKKAIHLSSNHKRIVEGEFIENLPLVEKFMCNSESLSPVKMKMKIQLELPVHSNERFGFKSHGSPNSIDFNSSPDLNDGEKYFKPRNNDGMSKKKKKIGHSWTSVKEPHADKKTKIYSRIDRCNNELDDDIETSQDENQYENSDRNSLKAEDVVIVYETPGLKRKSESPVMFKKAKCNSKKDNSKSSKISTISPSISSSNSTTLLSNGSKAKVTSQSPISNNPDTDLFNIISPCELDSLKSHSSHSPIASLDEFSNSSEINCKSTSKLHSSTGASNVRSEEHRSRSRSCSRPECQQFTPRSESRNSSYYSRSRSHSRSHSRSTRSFTRSHSRSHSFTRSYSRSISSHSRSSSHYERSHSYYRRSSSSSSRSSSSTNSFSSSDCESSVGRRSRLSTSTNSSYCRRRTSSVSSLSSASTNSVSSSVSSCSLGYHRRSKRRYWKRSPSIVRRHGSPSWLKKRRITSARKRPIPYHRPTPSNSTCSSRSSSRSNSAKKSPVTRYQKGYNSREAVNYNRANFK